MASEKRLAVLITANAKQAQQEFGKLGSAAEKSGSRTTRALSGMQKGLVGLGVGAAALGSFKAFEESEKIARQTDAVIKSTGGSAQVTSKHISDLASEMSKLAGIDDEMIQSGENMLLTFTNIRNEAGKGNDVFDQAAKTALDMSVAMGTDMTSSAVQLGKALNDPIKGVSALSKVGVTFTDGQKKMIQSLVESGDLMGAQKVILAELAKEFGGSAEAQATASGKAQVAMENLGEAAGSILAPGLELLAGAGTKAAEGLAELPVPAQQAIVGVSGLAAAAAYGVPKVIELAGSMKDGVTTVRDWGKRMNEAGNLSKFTAGLGVAAAGVGAFTLTLEALNAAAESGIDVGGLTTDLEQLGAGSAEFSDVLGTMGTDVEGLAAAFGQSVRAPRDFGDSMGYLAKNLGKGGDWNGTDLRKAENTVKDLDAALTSAVKGGNIEAARTAYGELAAALMEQGFTAEEVALQLPAFHDELDRTDRAARGVAGSLGEAAGKAQEMTTGTEDAGKATRNATDFYKRNADALQEIRDNAAEATSKIREFYDESTNQVADQIDVERALDAASQAFKDNGLALSISAEKGRENREAIIAARDAQLEYAMTLRDTSGTGAAIESMVTYSGRLYDTMIQAGFTKAQAAALIAEMKLTPKDIYTTFRSNATEAEQRAADVRQSIQNVPGWKDIYFNALTDEAKAKIAELSQIANKVGGSVLSGTAGAAIQQSAAAHGRWGAVTAYAKGGITPAHITRDQLFKYGEPATGGEAFVPRKGDKKRSTAILGEAAGWYGMQVIPMAKGGLNRSWGEAGVKVGTVFEDGSVVTAADMERYRRSQRQTATFGSASTTVNPGRPPAVFGSSTGAGITINVFEAKDARNTARQVVAEINRATRMGQSPLVGSRR